jgi:hypothetical protein
MTNRDKLLVEALGALQPAQLDRLMRTAQKRHLPGGNGTAGELDWR